jgi:hypothetical protein
MEYTSMMLPQINYNGNSCVYGRFLPSGHIPIPYVYGYDMNPLHLGKKEFS